MTIAKPQEPLFLRGAEGEIPPAPSELELSATQMHEMVQAAMARIVAYIASLPSLPARDVEGAEAVAAALKEALPATGQPFEELLRLLFEEALPKSFNSAGPSYLAYIPGGGIFHAAVGDLIANALNRYTGIWIAAPGLVQLETNVIRWFCQLVGYPASAGGFLTTGGSLANLSAVVSARQERLPPDFLRGTIYTSTESHHSVRKAAVLAGFPSQNVRVIPVDAHQRIRLDALQTTIAQDRQAGFVPFLLVANAGTTNTGAVDPLDDIAEIAQTHKLWLHVDAAYGGFFMLTEHGKQAMRGLQRADSITLDPHKGLFLPFGTGCLLVRDLQTLKRTHSTHADYMPPTQEIPEHLDFCEISPELSRDFRGLRLWLPLKMHGFDTWRQYLDEKLQLTLWLTQALRNTPHIQIVTEPQLSLVTFRALVPGKTDEEIDALNQELLRRIVARQRVFLTPTRLQGRFVIRVCVLCFRTHHDRIQMCLEDIQTSLLELLPT